MDFLDNAALTAACDATRLLVDDFNTALGTSYTFPYSSTTLVILPTSRYNEAMPAPPTRSTETATFRASRGVVLQSYKDGPIPEWMSCCQQSVKRWAQRHNMDYVFIGDELFEDVPPWAVERAHNQKLILSDWGRLAWLRRILASGAECAVWMDFDIIVLDPNLSIRFDVPFRACTEWWLQHSTLNSVLIKRAINNAVLAVRSDALKIIDFLLISGEARLRNAHGRPDPRIIGTTLLTELACTWSIPARRDVLTTSPHLLLDIVTEDGRLYKTFQMLEPALPRAANLCGSFIGRNFIGVEVTDGMMLTAIDRLHRLTA